MQSISPYSVRKRENTDKNNSEYGHFLRSESNRINISYSDTYMEAVISFKL